MRRLTCLPGIALTLTTLALAVTTPPASGDDTTVIVGTDDSAFNVGASSADQDHDPKPPTPSTTTPTGHWETRPQCTLGGSQTCADITTCPDGTPMQHLQYILPNGTITATTTRCPTEQPPPGPTPTDIYTAFKTIPLPTPTLHIQPPDGQTLVNLPTIYYTTPTTIDTTLTVLDTTVDFHITTTYTWHYGDHTTTTTTNPGAPYPHQTNTHTYHHHGTTHPSLDTTYQADYRIHPGTWQHLTQTITITSPQQTLTIHTATPHLTGN
jgi:hypothetical protein